MRLVVATNNMGKLKEFSKILGELNFEVVSLKDIGLDIDVVEDCDTFEGNAIKKAKEVCDICKEIVLSDDSGLCVDYINGDPGVYSARYAQPNPTSEKNNMKLLEALKGVPTEKRGAKFVCTIAVAFPDGKIITSRGETSGIILEELQGNEGFGYDPLFFYPEYNKTFAQMSQDEKNKISHRGKAISEIKQKLEEII